MYITLSFPGGSDSKKSTCNVGDLGLIPGPGRSPGGGHGNLLQCSCLENPREQRSLVGYSPLRHKELHMTERLSRAQYFEEEVMRWPCETQNDVCVHVCTRTPPQSGLCMCVCMYTPSGLQEVLGFTVTTKTYPLCPIRPMLRPHLNPYWLCGLVKIIQLVCISVNLG